MIKYLHKKGLAPKAIHADMVATLGKDAPSYATVKRWVAAFKRGKESLEDEPSSGRPVIVGTPEIVIKVHDMVISDRRVTERYIACAVGIFQERVHSILTEDLDMRNLSAHWVARPLTDDQKHTRQNMSHADLNVFRQILTSFC